MPNTSSASQRCFYYSRHRSWDNIPTPTSLLWYFSHTAEECLHQLSPPPYSFFQATMQSCCASLHYHLALLSFNPFPMPLMQLASLPNTLAALLQAYLMHSEINPVFPP